jgi:hypothetical protein
MHNAPSREQSAMPASTPALLRKLGTPRDMRTFGHVERTGDEGLDHATALRISGETAWAKKIVETLQWFYPGHAWEVTVDSRHGGAQIRIAVLMTGPHCYFMRFSDIDSENAFRRRVMIAGGDLLERFNIPRAGFDLTRYVEARPKAVFHHNQRMPGE